MSGWTTGAAVGTDATLTVNFPELIYWTMNCRVAQRLLSAERDGELSSTERAELSVHLAGCADCQRVREMMEQAADRWRASVQAAPVPEADRAWQDIRREIRASSAAERREPRSWWSWAAPLGAAAALALVAAKLAPQWTAGPAQATTVRAETARAEFVEVSGDASSVVYVDDRSGWLVVWAVPEKG